MSLISSVLHWWSVYNIHSVQVWCFWWSEIQYCGAGLNSLWIFIIGLIPFIHSVIGFFGIGKLPYRLISLYFSNETDFPSVTNTDLISSFKQKMFLGSNLCVRSCPANSSQWVSSSFQSFLLNSQLPRLQL